LRWSVDEHFFEAASKFGASLNLSICALCGPNSMKPVVIQVGPFSTFSKRLDCSTFPCCTYIVEAMFPMSHAMLTRPEP